MTGEGFWRPPIPAGGARGRDDMYRPGADSPMWEIRSVDCWKMQSKFLQSLVSISPACVLCKKSENGFSGS